MVRRGPLHGLKVIELAHIMAGPACGMLLADLGADVIKVEKVPGGDASRDMVPPTVQGESAAFMMLNRNKRGIAVDLKTEAGRTLMRDMLVTADVVIENYRVGTMERFGLGYERLRDANSRLIYCAISGFGRTGPLGSMAGFDLIAQGYSGLMSITGEGTARPPVKCGAPMTDITSGILAALGILAAIVDRERTGTGQRVETSLFEAGIIHTFWQAAIFLSTGVSPTPLGSAHPLSAPYQAFETADGWINIGASSEASWQRLPPAMNLPELLSDARFTTNADRMAHLDELVGLLSPVFKRRTTSEWLTDLEGAGVPAGPVLTIGEMLEHPQTLARNMVTEVDHSLVGTMRTLGCPIKMDSRDPGRSRPAPVLGEHTIDILREYGLTESAIADLRETGAVFCA
jgi:crotonobetainyl-CoA:carnitine CoA-transferase CaiB-like acyl-CoA transferase